MFTGGIRFCKNMFLFMKIEGLLCHLQITERSDRTNLVSHDASLSEVHVNFSHCLLHPATDFLKLLKLLETSCYVSNLWFPSSLLVLGDGEKAGRINCDMSTAGTYCSAIDFWDTSKLNLSSWKFAWRKSNSVFLTETHKRYHPWQ